MLKDMKKLSDTSSSITIGYEAGSESNGKAEGNIKGTYGSTKMTKKDPKTGKRVPRVMKKRDFLGISDNQLNRIIKEYKVSKRLDEAINGDED